MPGTVDRALAVVVGLDGPRSLRGCVLVTTPGVGRVAGALGRYFHGGSGPSHSRLTTVFLNSGYGDADPYDAADGTPNKEVRVQQSHSIE